MIVDVLAFSTSVVLTASNGGTALSYSAAEIDEMGGRERVAELLNAEIVAKDRAATSARFSLSPASLATIAAGDRLVFTSLNGAACTAAAADGPVVLIGALTNASATARVVESMLADGVASRCTVVPCGERWPSVADEPDSLRPSIEDLLGAGAVVAAVQRLTTSPEAAVAAACFRSMRGEIRELLRRSVSGRELIDRGFPQDVELASDVDSSEAVPRWDTSNPVREFSHRHGSEVTSGAPPAVPVKIVRAGGAVGASGVEHWPGEVWAAHPEAGAIDRQVLALRHSAAASRSFAMHASKNGLAYVDIGATDIPVRAQSVRKSLMNALIGVAYQEGLLHPDATLGDLAIDDIEGLSAVERSATIRDVVMARSGVYHPAAYQPVPAPLLPPRGTDRPGERWTYNNWDFNVLGSILRTVSGLGPYDAFHAWIAQPLGMQEFDPDHNEYTLESISQHPAYDFRISARDLSRFGLLYLRRGRWRDAQVISEEWVGTSTYPWSPVPAPYAHVMAAFGYLWWIGRPDDLGGREFFAALGGQGHALLVVPEEDIVVVHRNHDHDTTPLWAEVLPLLRRTVEIGGALR